HVRTIGILASQSLPPIQRFARKLRDYGYVEGRNLRLVSRFAEGQDERYPVMAAELAAMPVDLIVTWGTPAALAAKQATTPIPALMGALGGPGNDEESRRDGRHGRSRQRRYRVQSCAPGRQHHGLRRAERRFGRQATGTAERLAPASLPRRHASELGQPNAGRLAAETAPRRRDVTGGSRGVRHPGRWRARGRIAAPPPSPSRRGSGRARPSVADPAKRHRGCSGEEQAAGGI